MLMFASTTVLYKYMYMKSHGNDVLNLSDNVHYIKALCTKPLRDVIL